MYVYTLLGDRRFLFIRHYYLKSQFSLFERRKDVETSQNDPRPSMCVILSFHRILYGIESSSRMLPYLIFILNHIKNWWFGMWIIQLLWIQHLSIYKKFNHWTISIFNLNWKLIQIYMFWNGYGVSVLLLFFFSLL